MKIKLYNFSYIKRNVALYAKLYLNHIFVQEIDNPVKKVIVDEEELDSIEEIDAILNLVNLPRTMFID